MRFRVSFIASFLAVAFLALAAGVQAQDQGTTAKPVANGTYVVVDPLAAVRYDNRYDLSLGLAYDHMKAGPTLLQGSNLGGLDISGSYWLAKHWGLEGSGRAYVGTSGAGVNSVGVQGPFVSQYLFVAGPEWLGPHNKHIALIPHALVGGAYGDFNKELGRGGSTTGPSGVAAFYDNQFALGGAVHEDFQQRLAGGL